MTLQQDIQTQINLLPDNLRQPINVLLKAISQQKQDQFTDKEIEQRLKQAVEKQLQEGTDNAAQRVNND